MLLESMLHARSCFLTLTYDTESLPWYRSASSIRTIQPTLYPRDLQLFMKRFRRSLGSHRFFAVGEYGDENFRPHYHAIIFGGPVCRYGVTRKPPLYARCCDVCDSVREIWSHGAIEVAQANEHTMQYVAGYVVKKMTAVTDDRLYGRYPEFARMSLRPGIGRDAMVDIASQIMAHPQVEGRLVDVPTQVRLNGRLVPLSRYLRQWLRRYIGRSHSAPQEIIEALESEMRPVLQAAFSNPQIGVSPYTLIAHALRDEQAARNLLCRDRIFSSRRNL